jgi:hypothetical protein
MLPFSWQNLGVGGLLAFSVTILSLASGLWNDKQGNAGAAWSRVGLGGDGASCNEEDLMQWALEQGVYAKKLQAANFAFENPSINSSIWTERSVCACHWLLLSRECIRREGFQTETNQWKLSYPNYYFNLFNIILGSTSTFFPQGL